MNYPAAELRGIKSLNQIVEEGELASMDLTVCAPLLVNILSDHFLVPVLADGIRIVSARPELSTPEHLLDFGVTAEDFLRSDALDGLNYCRRGHHGDALDEKMDVVFIRAYLDEMDLVSFSDPHADILECHLDRFCKDLSSILGGADDVVEKQGLVVTFEDMFTHTPILPQARARGNAFGKDIPAAELRGIC